MAPPRRCWRWLGATAVAVFAWAAQASVDINRATALDLQAFKGIGPAVAARVLDARQQGAFKDWPDLMARVHGMGPHKADQLSAQGLTVKGWFDSPIAGGDGNREFFIHARHVPI